MKKIFYFLLMAVIALPLSAQAPQSFKYQAALRDTDGAPLASKSVSLRIGIVAGTAAGNAVYTETHSVTTDAYGMVNLEIGKGAPQSGVFADIDWSAGSHFVKIELDVAGGSNYVLLGTSQLLSVPYALYAEKAGNIPDLSEYPTWEEITPEGTPKLRVSEQGDTLSLGKDNYVIIAGISALNNVNYPRLLDISVTNVRRNAEKDVVFTLSIRVKSKMEPDLYHSGYSFYTESGKFNVSYSDGQWDMVEAGVWQLTGTRIIENSRYIAATTGHLVDIEIEADYIDIVPAPVEVAIPGGEIAAPQPVITDVQINYNYGNAEIMVTTEGMDPAYITYTQTVPGGNPEERQAGTNIWLNKEETPAGTVFSNFRVTDIVGQTSDVWNGMVTYTLSSECDILSFRDNIQGNYWTINGTNISYTFPVGTTPLVISPQIEISFGATITPNLGEPQDFFTENGVQYTVTAEDGVTKKVYTVKATVTLSSACDIINFYTEEYGYNWSISETNITGTFPVAVPTMMTPNITYSHSATITPDPSIPQNFFVEDGVQYTITAEDEVTTKTYTVKAAMAMNLQSLEVSNVESDGMNQIHITIQYRVRSTSAPQGFSVGYLQNTNNYIDCYYSSFSNPVSVGNNEWTGEIEFYCSSTTPAGQYTLKGLSLRNDIGDCSLGDLPVTIPDYSLNIENVEIKNVSFVYSGAWTYNISITVKYTAISKFPPNNIYTNLLGLEGIKTENIFTSTFETPTKISDNKWEGEVTFTLATNDLLTAGEYILKGFGLGNNTSHGYWNDISITIPEGGIEILQVKSVIRNTQEVKIILTYRASFIPENFIGLKITNGVNNYGFSYPMFGPPTKAGDYWEGDVAFTSSLHDNDIPGGVYDISEFCVGMSVNGGRTVCNYDNVQVTIPANPRPVIQEITVKNVTRNQNQVAVVLSYTAESTVVPTNAACNNLQAIASYNSSNRNFGIPVDNGSYWSGEVTFTFVDVPAGNYYLTGFMLSNENGNSDQWQNISVTVP